MHKSITIIIAILVAGGLVAYYLHLEHNRYEITTTSKCGPLGIAYDTDLNVAEKVLIKTVQAHPEIIDKPKPRVRFRKFGDSALELEVLGVIGKPADRGRITHELIKSLHNKLRKENIKSPFPQRDIHLYKKGD